MNNVTGEGGTNTKQKRRGGWPWKETENFLWELNKNEDVNGNRRFGD